MPPITKNLGLIRAIHEGVNPPLNIKMLWYNTNPTINKHFYFDVVDLVWKPLYAGGNGGIPEAPEDGQLYGRIDGGWEAIPNIDENIIYGKYLISGFPIWSGTGLVYDYPAIEYFWDTHKTTSNGQITLTPADANYGRFDAFVIDNNGDVVVLPGTPSANPVLPIITDDYLLVSFVSISANALIPDGATFEVIYNENTEWTTSANQTGQPHPIIGSIDFNSTAQKKVGSVSTHFNSNDRLQATYTSSSIIGKDTFDTIAFWIFLIEPLNDGRRFELNIHNNIGKVNQATIDIKNNINRTLLNEWQLCTLSLSDFDLSSDFNKIIFIFTLGSPTVQRDLYIDNIRLISGNIINKNSKILTVQKEGNQVGKTERINFKAGSGINLEVVEDVVNSRINIEVSASGGGVPNVDTIPNFAGFQFMGEDVYSLYISTTDEKESLSDNNIGIGVEVHRNIVRDECGNVQGIVFYYTLGDNLCEEGYSSGGGEICIKNFYSEDDMIDYISYVKDSCIETIEWTGTQITSSINFNGDDFSIVIINNANLTFIKTENITTLNHNNGIIYNPVLTSIEQGALTSIGGRNEIYSNPALTTLDQSALTSVGGRNEILSNQALTTLDQSALTSVGGRNYIHYNPALTTLDQSALTSVGENNNIYSNPALTTIIVASSLTFTNVNNDSQIYAYYGNNALNQITVDAICDAILAGSTVIPINGAYLRLDGGTNAIPSGTRITDLQTAGWTVTTN